MEEDIKGIINNKFNQPFTTYVMGKENYENLLKLGIKDKGHDCKLVNENPFTFDLIKFQYRNKMEIIKYALQFVDHKILERIILTIFFTDEESIEGIIKTWFALKKEIGETIKEALKNNG